MTYYEELGLAPDATSEQIRRAYRNLARLLHPDQQADEDLRRLAEGQMKRLNAVHGTLTDPARKQEYDASLVKERALTTIPTGPAGPRLSLYRDVGLVVVGLAAASLYWQLTNLPRRGAETQPPTRTNPQIQAGAPGRKAEARRRQPSSSVDAQINTRVGEEGMNVGRGEAALPGTLESHFEPPAEMSVRVLAPEAIPAATVTTEASSPAAAERTPALDDLCFAGTWVYVRPRVPPSERSVYPADYIEAVIVQQSGVVRGRYRARYEVADRPISSEVAFRFEGKVENDLATLLWTGAGGAEGELKLKLLSKNVMQLDWIATALGTQLGLGSGTAVLVRKQDR